MINQHETKRMYNLYALKLSTGYCGTTAYEFVISEASNIAEYAQEAAYQNYDTYGLQEDEAYELISNGVEPDEAYEIAYELMQERAEYSLVKLVEDYRGTEKDAIAEFTCPSLYFSGW